MKYLLLALILISFLATGVWAINDGKVRVTNNYFSTDSGPFFVNGAFNTSFEDLTNAQIDSELTLMHEKGFNTYFAFMNIWKLLDADTSNDTACSRNVYGLNKAKSLGMKVIFWADGSHRYGENLEFSYYLSRCSGIVNHDALLGYTLKAGEIRFGGYGENSNFALIKRRNLDPAFWSFLVKEYGSVASANTKLNYTFQEYPPDNDAVCVSNDIPTQMKPGQPYTVHFTFRNTGTKTWVAQASSPPIPEHFALAIGDSEKFLLPNSKISSFGQELPNNVNSEQTVELTAEVTAPLVPGDYELGWQMMEWNQPLFGTACKETVHVASDATDTQSLKTFDYAWHTQLAVKGMPNDFCTQTNSTTPAYVVYKRFLDEFFNQIWKVNYTKAKTADPTTLFTSEQGIGLIPSQFMCDGGGDETAGSFLGTFSGAKNLDFISAEGYIASDEWHGLVNQPQMSLQQKQAYLTLANGFSQVGGKPVLMMEYGRHVNGNTHFTENDQQQYYRDYLAASKLARITGGNLAWSFLISTDVDQSQLSLRKSDGSSRLAQTEISSFVPPTLPYVFTATDSVELDREKYSFDAWAIAEQYTNTLSKIQAGKTVAVNSFCSSKNTSTFQQCAGGASGGNCSAKCFNAQFDSIQIKGSDGQWKKVRNGDIIKVEKDNPISFKVKMGNSGEGSWNSNAQLKLTGLLDASGNPFVKNTGSVLGFGTYDFGEFTTKGILNDTTVNAMMNIVGFTGFGEQIQFKLKPEITVFSTCQALYANHNDPTDPKRFNIVLAPIGFSAPDIAVDRAKKLIDLDNTSNTAYGYPGFMQTFPMNQPGNADKFNFWVVTPASFDAFNAAASSPNTCLDNAFFDACGFLETNGHPQNYNFTFTERQAGRNYPQVAGATSQANCGFASLGRTGAGLDFPENFNTSFYNVNNFKERKDIMAANIHEMSHSIFLIFDEYIAREFRADGAYPGASPQADPTFNDFSQAVVGNNSLSYQDVPQFYFHRPGEPVATRADCLTNSLWKDYLGDGCGEQGVVDCLVDPNDPYSSCTDGSQNCWYEVACVQGARWPTGSFRPTMNSLINSHYNQTVLRYGYWDDLLVNHVLQKGATNIQKYAELFSDFVPPVEQCSNGLDDDLDGFFDCSDRTCTANPVCANPVKSCTIVANPSTLNASGTSTMTVTPVNFSTPPSTAQIKCFDTDSAFNASLNSGTYAHTCSYTATSNPQSFTASATVDTVTCNTTVTVNATTTPVVEQCSNQIDDDLDGDVDCSDTDCSADLACQIVPVSFGSCPLKSGNDSITRADNAVTIDLTDLTNPSVDLFTAQNEAINCTVNNSTGSCVIPSVNSSERSFKVTVNCDQADGSRGKTNYFVTLYPSSNNSARSVPDIPFEFVFLIAAIGVMIISRNKN